MFQEIIVGVMETIVVVIHQSQITVLVVLVIMDFQIIVCVIYNQNLRVMQLYQHFYYKD